MNPYKIPASRLELNEEVIQLLEKHVRVAIDFKYACVMSGVNYSTFCNWIREGRAKPESLYGELLFRMQLAIGKLEASLLTSMFEHINGRPAAYAQVVKSEVVLPDGTIKREFESVKTQDELKPDRAALQWIMSRKFRQQWGDHVQITVDKETGDPFQDPIKAERPVLQDTRTPEEVLERIQHLAQQAQMIKEYGAEGDVEATED